MAVMQKYRRFGVGGMVLDFLEQIALNEGIQQITLNAQEYVKKFYDNHGYKEEGDVFIEAGIPHVTMVKTIFKEI
jgi:predicted GNAT family N-acyltransferase